MKNFLESKGLTEASLKEKSAEELAALYNEYNETKNVELEKAIETKATKEDIDALKSEIKTAQVEQMKALNETLKQHGVAIKKLTQQEKEAGVGHLNSISKGLEDNREVVSALQKHSTRLGFELPLEVGNYLIKQFSNDLSELLAVLKLLEQATLVQKRRLTLPFVKQVLNAA